MTYTVDRINALLAAIGHEPVEPSRLFITGRFDTKLDRFVDVNHEPAHTLLDTIDKHVGIITRWTCACWQGQKLHKSVPETVGNRVSRLERHIERNKTPLYFYLGEEANNVQAIS